MDFIRRFWQQESMLRLAIVYQVALLIVSLPGLVIDTRLVTGINPWVKPIKFEVSLILFLSTVSWLLLHLPASASVKRILGGGIAIAMVIEITAIVVQAGRGVPSHFNHQTPFDSAVFALMGITIVLNTLLICWLAALYFRTQPALAPAVVMGVRLGLVLFVLASLQGFVMVGNHAHTAGGPDGGPGLFFLNWSTMFGDLRVAHFVGMHGIQVLPILGWLLSRTERQAGTRAVVIAFAVMLLIFGGTLFQALSGNPLVPAASPQGAVLRFRP